MVMKELRDVHALIQEKKRRRREITRSFQDELAQNGQYKEVVEQLKKLREKKKSIENAVYAAAAQEAEKMDLLKLEIKDHNQMLADIALSLYAQNRPVEIVDENETRWTPEFSVRFKKEKQEAEETVAAAERAATHPERLHAPVPA